MDFLLTAKRDLAAARRYLERAINLHGLLLRPDLIPTQGPKLFEVEYGGASRSNFGDAHACQ